MLCADTMRNDSIYPRQSPTTHTEQLGDEASVYDWARARVHALNPTAARVWRLCDGVTSPGAIAAALRVETGVLEADAVVDLTLRQLARIHVLELPIEARGARPATTRRWLLGRGVAAAMLPAIYSIVAPSSVEAQSLPAAAPTLTSLSPNQGSLGTTVAVTMTGTNFVVGATTVTVSSGGVTAANVVVSSATSLTVNIVIDVAATPGAHTVTVTTPGGTSAPQTFTVSAAAAPTLTSVTPNQGLQGATVAVTLTGTNFVAGATVAVSGTGVTVNTIVVVNSTSLTANFVLEPAATVGARAVTVTTPGGTSGGQTFMVSAAAPPPPTLTSVSPNLGTKGTTAITVPVTLTGTNFVAGAMVAVSGTGVTVNTIVVVNSTSLTANFVIDPAAATGARTVTVTTSGGTSGGQTFTINLPAAPTLTSVSPNEGLRGTTVAVTLTGTNFVAGATVAVSGTGVTVNTIVVGSSTSLTANFVLDGLAADDLRAVTVTTAGGTSGSQTFLIRLPHGAETFIFTGVPRTFTVPPGVASIKVEAVGAAGGNSAPIPSSSTIFGAGGRGGKVDARVSVTPLSTLTVRVGGTGQAGVVGSTAVGGFNGGGGSTGDRGGGGGGASDVYAGATPLVIAGGGGGSGYKESGGGGEGGDGGDLTGRDGEINPVGGRWGGGGGQLSGGAGGAGGGSVTATNGTAGIAGTGGTGGANQPGVLGGGGGGGGRFGGGGGGGGTPGSGGGGGGSSFTALGATEVAHVQGSATASGVIISW